MIKKSVEVKVVSFDLDGTLVTKEFDNALWHSEIPSKYAKKRGINLKLAIVELNTMI